MPVGNALPMSRVSSVPPRGSDSILTAFRARTDFSELKQIDSAWDEDSSDSVDDGWDDEVAADDCRALRNSALELKVPAASNAVELAHARRTDTSEPARAYDARIVQMAPASKTRQNWGLGEAEPAEPSPGELTPSPMVVCEASSSSNASPPSSISIAENEDFVWRGSSLECGIGVWRSQPPDDEECTGEIPRSPDADGAATRHVEYHAPRPPPSSVTPPKLEASVCVATDFDPKASTQPRIPRSIPASPMLLGLDRMLIWGMLLGGLFVAVIVVIVNQVALTKLPPAPGNLVAARQLQSTVREPSASTPAASLESRRDSVAASGAAVASSASAEAGGQAGISAGRETPAHRSKKARSNDKGHVPVPGTSSAAPFSPDKPLLGSDRSLQRLAEPKQ